MLNTGEEKLMEVGYSHEKKMCQFNNKKLDKVINIFEDIKILEVYDNFPILICES